MRFFVVVGEEWNALACPAKCAGKWSRYTRDDHPCDVCHLFVGLSNPVFCFLGYSCVSLVPLDFQNNLHELWALLNFLLPTVFQDSEAFSKVFDLNVDDADKKQNMIKQLHKILRYEQEQLHGGCDAMSMCCACVSQPSVVCGRRCIAVVKSNLYQRLTIVLVKAGVGH